MRIYLSTSTYTLYTGQKHRESKRERARMRESVREIEQMRQRDRENDYLTNTTKFIVILVC
jgi:hypothetical protein